MIDETLEAIDALPECETFVNSTTPHDGMVLFTDDLKALVAELKQLREFVGSSGRMEQEYALWQLNRGESK